MNALVMHMTASIIRKVLRNIFQKYHSSLKKSAVRKKHRIDQ
jgi:hypothetical protein